MGEKEYPAQAVPDHPPRYERAWKRALRLKQKEETGGEQQSETVHSDPASSPRRLLIQGEKRTEGYHTVRRLNQMEGLPAIVMQADLFAQAGEATLFQNTKTVVYRGQSFR